MNDPLAYVRQWRQQFDRSGWWHSFELPDGSKVEGVCDLGSLRKRLAQFPIPDDLRGKRVLDIGAWDGWFSFEMEKRGAEVVAIDRFENPRFLEMRERLRSRVDYRRMDVYDVSPRTLGRYDIVLFLGVFYHLKHPLLALERVCSVATDLAAVESYVLPELEDQNVARFYEEDDFGGQVDNWWAPTTRCLLSLCRTAGFAGVELANRHEYGAAVTCRRKWKAGLQGPELLAAVNAEDFGINFRSERDEYVMCCAQGTGLTRDNVFPEVGGYGIRPVHVGPMEGDNTSVLFKLPPGLTAGWHAVRLGAGGNASSVAVDVDATAERLTIQGACDGVTWKAGQVSLSGGILSVWVKGMPENADIGNVTVEVEGKRQGVTFVGAPDPSGARQVNVRLRCSTGAHPVAVRHGSTRSADFAVDFVD